MNRQATSAVAVVLAFVKRGVLDSQKSADFKIASKTFRNLDGPEDRWAIKFLSDLT